MALVSGFANAAPVKPVVPCGVMVFGGGEVRGLGVRASGAADLPSRMATFFRRVCGGQVRFSSIASVGAGLLDDVAGIADQLAKSPRSVAFVHFPFAGVESGASVDELVQAYGTILGACQSSGSICIIGGQQPVESSSQEEADRQVMLEHRASVAYGASYLPLYRYFQSESGSRRLIVLFDSGDGRHLDDRGHELLFKIYRRRLLELTGAMG